MMAMSNKERQAANVIAPWLTSLAGLTTGGKEPMTKERLLLYTQILSREMPAAAFTMESLYAVADGCEFFPTYKTLKEALDKWRAANTPSVNLPRTPISQSLEEHLDERADNDTYRAKMSKRMADAKADWSNPDIVRQTVTKIDVTHPMRMVVGRFFAGLVRKHAPQNLGLLLPEWLDPNERT